MPVNYRNYPPDWKDIIRPRILKRDCYKCVVCGVSNRALFVWDCGNRVILDDTFILDHYVQRNFKIKKIVLTISHSCHNSMCENDNHLSSKCQLHHLREDLALHVMNRKITNASKKGIHLVAPIVVGKDCVIKQ